VVRGSFSTLQLAAARPIPTGKTWGGGEADARAARRRMPTNQFHHYRYDSALRKARHLASITHLDGHGEKKVDGSREIA